jgi:hypothetical protein
MRPIPGMRLIHASGRLAKWTYRAAIVLNKEAGFCDIRVESKPSSKDAGAAMNTTAAPKNTTRSATRTPWGLTLCTVAALGVSAAAHASEEPRTTATGLSYSLVDAPLLPSTRWVHPDSLIRLEVAAGLAPRHELRLSAAPTAFDAIVLGGEASFALDAPRATYRYTLMERPSWSWKVGLTSNLRDAAEPARAGVSEARARFGAVPLMHVAGEARLAQRWQLFVDADGIMTQRGRALDIGMRVNYRLSPSFSLYGGWRVSESGGDAEDLYTPGLSGAANFGVRWRF